MKLLFGFIILMSITPVWATLPDPRDSIILESKVVAPGTHPGPSFDTAAYVYLRVWITNKDTLTGIHLPYEERSLSGGAYLVVAHPRTFDGTVNRLTYTLNFTSVTAYSRYNSVSPDSALLAGFASDDPSRNSLELPNAVRKPFWELKFDTVLAAFGQVQLDSIVYPSGVSIGFVDQTPKDIKVNFVKSIISVAAAPKGDLNLDFRLMASDVVLELYCVMQGIPPPAGTNSCDLNCDGENTAADVVLLLNATFQEETFPC